MADVRKLNCLYFCKRKTEQNSEEIIIYKTYKWKKENAVGDW